MLKLAPYLSPKIWGSDKLSKVFNTKTKENIGEAWLVSTLEGKSSMITNLKSKVTLKEYFEKNKNLFNIPKYDKFPILIKFIDANDDLSIQVHPNDLEAQKLENESNGKSECWYIVECKKGSDIIYGLNNLTKSEITKKLKQRDFKDLFKISKIKTGDFFDIPSGVVHAIRKNTFIYELQQASDITYRIYDYDRKDTNGELRELHLDKSIKVLKTKSSKTKITKKSNLEYSYSNYLNSKYFGLSKVETKKDCLVKELSKKPFICVTSISELKGKINGNDINKYETFIFFQDEIKEGLKLSKKLSILISWPN